MSFPQTFNARLRVWISTNRLPNALPPFSDGTASSRWHSLSVTSHGVLFSFSAFSYLLSRICKNVYFVNLKNAKNCNSSAHAITLYVTVHSILRTVTSVLLRCRKIALTCFPLLRSYFCSYTGVPLNVCLSSAFYASIMHLIDIHWLNCYIKSQ